jgi:hypothetical protein
VNPPYLRHDVGSGGARDFLSLIAPLGLGRYRRSLVMHPQSQPAVLEWHTTLRLIEELQRLQEKDRAS